jgi:hypothetical protein
MRFSPTRAASRDGRRGLLRTYPACLLFGIYLVEETLEFVALIEPGCSSRRLSRCCFCVSSTAVLVIEGLTTVVHDMKAFFCLGHVASRAQPHYNGKLRLSFLFFFCAFSIRGRLRR